MPGARCALRRYTRDSSPGAHQKMLKMFLLAVRRAAHRSPEDLSMLTTSESCHRGEFTYEGRLQTGPIRFPEDDTAHRAAQIRADARGH